ncbi:Thiamine-triphosphatase [Orbilia brochopaga]|nr:Thiamine-triphosphatase [Drechslerella brochopaga]
MSRIYEVERKFFFTLANAAKFHSNEGVPPFSSVIFSSTKTQHDRYYDTRSYDLDRNNIWARLRNGNWQIKRLISGTHEKAAYEEFDGYRSLVKIMHDLGLKEWKDMDAGKLSLHKVADFRTERKSYIVNENFNVVLDSTDFGHSVGEVELKGEDYKQCGKEIDELMAEHRWFFNITRPAKSKLAAYWQKFPRGY